MKRTSFFVMPLVALALLISATGCSSLGKTEKGAGIGAAAGGVIGGIIGNRSDNTAKGAIIGAAVGGAAGAIIGAQMDKQAEELEDELEGAEVERVGEGIQITFDSAILFATNSSTVSSASQQNLMSLANSLQTYPNTEVLITGHTDATGTDAYNQTLSEERAGSVAAILMQNSVQGTRVKTMGLGETQPIADNGTAAGRQQNRRVEVAIFATEEYRQEVESGSGE
ncbi:MAG: OmpA family protein [Bacteroidota bacterium]